MVNIKKTVIRVVLVAVGAPVVFVVIAVASFYARFYVPNQSSKTIVSLGEEREYLLYVPETYDRTKSTPLVISMHAAALWPATQMETSQWNEVADEHGFLVVYPSGMTPSGTGTGVRPKVWSIRPEADASANVQFISDLIDALEVDYNIDPSRIYANGFSNGGAMTFALSCRLSGRIAAVATVAAAHDQQPFGWCGDARPMPMISFHGLADKLVPYDGGRSWATPRPFPSVLTWTADWARRNRCGETPIESGEAADVTRLEYTDCADDAAVVLYALRGGGHSWPGGAPGPEWLLGPTSDSLDATRLMWAFFLEHPLPRR